ncbi:GNAT family N-acetyltransferase [Parvibaculaceae bacterium PLY_AMNH_Bact1]|nr:GNAT family N-acetyltransferase [Parvibaculaceae bacterium PLY_AMNH_Bact1]
MIDLLQWRTLPRHPDLWVKHHELRKAVFVDEKGWGVPSFDGLEYDEYDTPSAVYMLSHENGEVLGCQRLLRCSQPYFMKDHFPDSVTEMPLPDTDRHWEASRFTIRQDISREAQAKVMGEICAAGIEFGLAHGIESYIYFTPADLFAVVSSYLPVELRTIGPEIDLSGEKNVAVESMNTLEGLRGLRELFGLPDDVLEPQTVREAA